MFFFHFLVEKKLCQFGRQRREHSAGGQKFSGVLGRGREIRMFDRLNVVCLHKTVLRYKVIIELFGTILALIF